MANKFYNSTAGGAGTGADWTNAYTTLSAAAAGMAAGDTLWIGDNSAESNASAQTITFPGTISSPCFLYVVDHTQASPGTGDLKIGAAGAGSFTTTGNNVISLNGSFYCYGLYISNGSGANAVSAAFGNAARDNQIYEKTVFFLGGTTGGVAQFALAADECCTELIDCKIKFSSASSTVRSNGHLLWRDSAPAVDTSVATPTNLFSAVSSGFIELVNLDLSSLTNKTLVPALSSVGCEISIKNCGLASGGVTGTASVNAGYRAVTIDNIRSDFAGTVIERTERYTYAGTQTLSSTIKRTGGANNGSSGFSWKIATTANSKWIMPFLSPPISIWNSTTGGTITIVMYGIADPRDFSALPLNDDLWFDVEYQSSASATLGAVTSGTKANNLATGSSLTADTSAWDSGITARADSTAYSLGDMIKVATNPGRVFLCTTAGTTAGSEPGGYATAVDGDSVTDNTAVFKAMWRFSLTVTTGTVQLAGPLIVKCKAAKASMNGIYIDPAPSIGGVTLSKSYISTGSILVNELSTGGAFVIGS